MLRILKIYLTIFQLNKRRIKLLGTVTEYNGRMELVLKDSKSIEIIASVGIYILIDKIECKLQNIFVSFRLEV